MKLVTVVVAGVLALGATACGKQAEAPKPAEAVKAAEKAEPAKAESVKPAEATKVEATPTAKAEGGEATAAHEGCGDHAAAAAAAAGEKDCPFDAERKNEAGGHESCGAGAGAAEAAEPMPAPGPAAGQVQMLGAPFALTESKPLGEVLKVAATDKEEVVRVAGTVDKVCQKRGCWMVVRDGDLEARVIMKDHAFAIPFDAKGLKATIEGSLKVKLYTEAQMKHLAEDGAEDPTKVSGEKKEFLVTATSVQLGG